MRIVRIVLSLVLLLTLSCMKSYTIVSGMPIDKRGITIIRIDSTRVGPEVFLKVYYRDKK
jgi:hypothetical protein